MAALLLSAFGAAAGGTMFGPVGAFAGRLAGALAGNAIDHALFGGGPVQRSIEGPRLSDLEIMASTEGAPIPRIYGRVRVIGELIWATKLEEAISTNTQTLGGGGKGGLGGSPAVTTTTTTYSYFGNIAVGLCEGEIAYVGRIWADGKPLDLTGVTMRVYRGTQTQTADPLIAAKEGAENAPAYRGLAYVVFERLALANFGSRIPQLSFEVVRPVGRLERMVRAVTLIPGATEFGYEPGTVLRVLGPGQTASENRHVTHAASDVMASLDELQGLCPNLERVALVVAWFGSDLRAGSCEIMPGVESAERQTENATWAVAGLDRTQAHLVSTFDGRPSYGGTPSDDSVSHLIEELNARGIKVTLYPFVMMDVPAGNSLPDPWTGASAQPPYPWRGTITCDPAPGQPGSPDGTAGAASQVAAFFGGTEDWGYRRMVLHYAALAAAAGGVDAFLIGSEFRSLTRVRSASGVYPAVTALIDLASEVRGIVGPSTKITYAADWTEYGAHVVDPEASEVRFPLDPLWASPDIDAIGIDYYAPLADWRDGSMHADRAETQTSYDRAYLTANLSAGEGYDWYYADADARAAQERTPITDGLGKPWTFRQKDLWSFWSNPHHERVGGVELTAPTAWDPQSKPIWLTEVGCPAVDKGANQPSVFPDPKSSVGGLPYFSNGGRDDLIQRRYIESLVAAFDPAFGASDAQNSPASAYDGRMVDPATLALWSWDSRPYPAFPAMTQVWGDGPNWETGHWLTGRLGTAPLEGLIAAILSDSGISAFDTSALGEGPEGYLIDRPMSPRAAIEPLAKAYAFDAAEHAGTLTFRHRGGDPVLELSEDDLVLASEAGAPFRLTRGQETELPREVSLGFTDSGADYRRAVASSRRLVVASSRALHTELAVVTSDTAAQRRAEIWLQDLWAGRTSGEVALPPSRLALAPGDVLGLTLAGRRHRLEVREITDTVQRALTLRSIDPDVFHQSVAAPRRQSPQQPTPVGRVHAVLLDLPTLEAGEPAVLLRAAVMADPWPGPVTIWRSADGLGFTPLTQVLAPATIGETVDDLPAGPTARFDRRRFRVRLYAGALSSISDAALFGGGNAAAVQRSDGAWEVLQFANAELVGERTYELSRLLRGQAGSEWAMADPIEAGAPFVLLNAHVMPVAQGLDELDRPMTLRIVASSRDHGDPAAVEMEAVPQSTALKPLAPVHLRAQRTDDGISIRWIRRARYDADSWTGEIALGEQSESYTLEILSAGETVRSFEISEPAALYAAADEIADFGAPQLSVEIRVAQKSATVGLGFATQSTLAL